MPELTLLRFQPILRNYLWGGRRLGTVLGKQLGDDEHYAESWEIVDHGKDQSIVVGGAFADRPLHELVADHGQSLFGRHNPQARFPLLFKFLDAQRTLSVQVHPNDEQAARLEPPDLGKTEAWLVVEADPNSKIYAGLKPGIGRGSLERALGNGECQACLHEFVAKVGDCVFIPAGTVHALGSGLLIAEIQQASDTTFRLFDWNHVDRDGNRRPLHVEQSLATIDFSRGPVAPQTTRRTERPNVERLVECEQFVLDRWQLTSPETIVNDDRFHILAIVDGAATIGADGTAQTLHRGETVLMPACCDVVEIAPEGRGVLIDMYLP